MTTDWPRLHALAVILDHAPGRELAEQLLAIVREYGELDDLSEREIEIVAQVADALTSYHHRNHAARSLLSPRGG